MLGRPQFLNHRFRRGRPMCLPAFDGSAFANPCPPKPTRANTWVRPYNTKTLSPQPIILTHSFR